MVGLQVFVPDLFCAYKVTTMLDGHIFIEGFGFSNYRSYTTLQRVGPCEKINVIIGQNNQGKSNILHFIRDYYSPRLKHLQAASDKPFETKSVDTPQIDRKDFTYFSLCRRRDGKRLLKEKQESEIWKVQDHVKNRLAVDCILDTASVNHNGGAWIDYCDKGGKAIFSPEYLDGIPEAIMAPHTWEQLARRVTNPPPNNVNKIRPIVIKTIFNPNNWIIPKVYLVPAVRKVAKGNFTTDLLANPFDGSSAVNMLSHIKDPPTTMRQERKRYNAFLKFVRGLLDNSDAELSIPTSQDAVHVIMDDKDLPLDQLGTGVQELILITLAATSIENSVICLEEPEIHLHPHLQRRLMQYLKDHTNNQYFITTHSAHIMDTPNTAVFHVSLENRSSVIRYAKNDSQRFSICHDLGYKASDLLQANAIIWVEGPSDRIYLKKWLNQEAPDLIEGLHFSIMFYGGGLHAYLTAEDMDGETLKNEFTKFISLTCINRNSAIIMDSDFTAPDQKLTSNKARLVEEFSQRLNRTGLCWITAGREIENYIEATVLAAGVKAIHEKWTPPSDIDKQFTNVTKWKNSKNKEADIAKAAVASEVAKNDKLSINILDLEAKLKELILFIKHANHINN